MGIFNAFNSIGGINQKIKELEANLHSLEFNMNTRNWQVARACWRMVKTDGEEIFRYLEKSSAAQTAVYKVLGQKFQGHRIMGFIYEVLRQTDVALKQEGY